MMTDDPRVLRSRTAILEAAIALFVENGIHGVTVDAVAARSAVAKTTLYRHWPTRNDLLLDVFRHFDHRFTPPSETDPPIAQLQDLTRQLAATMTQPEWTRALPSLLEVTRRIDEFAELHEAAMVGSGPLAGAIRRLIERGELPATTNVMELFVQIVGPITIGAIYAPESIDNAFADRLVSRLVHGANAEQVG